MDLIFGFIKGVASWEIIYFHRIAGKIKKLNGA